MHAHEKGLRLGIAELRRIDDVAAVFGQETGDAVDDPALIDARQGKDVFRMLHSHDFAKAGGEKRLLSHDATRSRKKTALE
jgi:hypothetical protein